MVFADTSFLFALFGNDAHTAAAQVWTQQAGQPIAVSALNRYELGIDTLRGLSEGDRAARCVALARGIRG